MTPAALPPWIPIPSGRDVTIEIDPAPPPAPDGAERERWDALVGENPRHFDAPILAFESYDGLSGVIRARRERYARLALQPGLATGVTILSVTGVITALDERGEPCVLLGRRGASTRVYPGLWELAPSGGIDPVDADTLTLHDIRAQFAQEASEELGLDLDPSPARPIALQPDIGGRSVDLVLRLDTGAPIDSLRPGVSWEIDAHRWVPLGGPVPDGCLETARVAWPEL